MTKIVEYQLPSGNRAEKRSALITTFLNEEAGTGNGCNASRYQYNVESFLNYRIFLKRPTQLNKGFDFTVNVSGLYFKKNRRYSNPSHNDIISALTDCKTNFPTHYSQIASLINDIYECHDALITPSGATFLDSDGNQHPIEIIVLAIKWLFMEQDCAYWNYSGRCMFYNALCDNRLL